MKRIVIVAMIFIANAGADDTNTTNIVATQPTKIINYNPVAEYAKLADPCITTKVTPGDFGLSANRGGGVIDLNLQRYINNATKAGLFIHEFDGDEEGLKMHVECLIDNSAKMAVASINLAHITKYKVFEEKDIKKLGKDEFQKIREIKSPEILKSYTRAKKLITKEQCRYFPEIGKEKIKCGELSFLFNRNVIAVNGRTIVSPNNYFNVNLTVPISVYDHSAEGI